MISRNHWLALGMLAGLAAAGQTGAVAQTLTVGDVNTVIAQAAKAASAFGTNSVIEVSDREGFILAVYGVNGTPSFAATGLAEINAIDKAGTAAYLSSNGEAFTTRTAGFIIQPHFPPGISNTGTGPLTGVGLSSLPFSDINHFRNPAAPAAGIANTSLSGNPGGVPLYKGGVLVGAVGVDSNTILSALVYVGGSDVDENIAIIGQSGYAPPSGILATQVLLNGIRLPYADYNGGSLGTESLIAPAFPPTASPGAPFQTLSPNPFSDIPGGEVRNAIIGSALPAISGQARLSQSDVLTILHQGAVRASQTRGAIRNPAGSPAEVFIVVVDYYASLSAPNAPAVLGSFRTPDATIFSYDVAGQKARTALFFSNNSMALSSRGVGFLAQGTYPPGIDGTASGPYGPPTYGPSNPNFGIVAGTSIFPAPFGIQTAVSIIPTSGIPLVPINAYLANGITVFPGGFPLYRNGVLIGAVGVSGDGVDQDDIIAAAATVGFEAPAPIRSDEYTYRGARLPYAKFPQNASL
jgi:uncharacterized protein GlcG (DUF336 family)